MSDANAHVSRRRFCAGACQVASGATLATLFTGCGGGSPTSPSGGGNVTTLGTVSGRFTTGRVDVTVAGTALAADGGAALVESVRTEAPAGELRVHILGVFSGSRPLRLDDPALPAAPQVESLRRLARGADGVFLRND